MKCFITIAVLACISFVSGEPPVPQSSYLPPNQQHQPNSNYLPPSNSYQAPTNNYLPPNRAQTPQNTYGAPGVTGAIFHKQSGYGAAQNSYGDDEKYGPAKYEFKYDVQDYEGNDFGHMESRDGDLAVGRYYVLLPDGRKQIVDYEADKQGYRPTIRYEQVNGGRNGYNNGYDSNAQQQGKFGGYQ